MGWLADLLKTVGKWRHERAEYRGARNITKAHLAQMRALVDEALEHQKWPPGAMTSQWAAAWSNNEPILAARMAGAQFGPIANAYRLAEQLQNGLAAGERDFDATSQAVGADRDFFERMRAGLDDADGALATTGWRKKRAR